MCNQSHNADPTGKRYQFTLRALLLTVVAVAVLCGAVAGNLDNIVRPRLVGKDTEMHDLFILFGTLGGIAMLGLLGIIIGPIVSALFITVWQIYGDAFKEYLPDVAVVLKKGQEAPKVSTGNEEEVQEPGAE